MQVDFSKMNFDEKGLIPAIVQDAATNAVLMLAYMNGESLAKTVETGYTWFWSRSRQELWNKGATSGHVQKVVSIDYDCDGDSLLVKVEQKGAACHTGNYSCFSYPLWNSGAGRNLPVPEPDGIHGILAELYRVIQDKRVHGGEKSYTRYLFMSGQDKILKKPAMNRARISSWPSMPLPANGRGPNRAFTFCPRVASPLRRTNSSPTGRNCPRLIPFIPSKTAWMKKTGMAGRP